MAMGYFQELLRSLFSPFVNIIFATSAAGSAITPKMSKEVLLTMVTIIGKVPLFGIVTKKHTIYFFDLLFSE